MTAIQRYSGPGVPTVQALKIASTTKNPNGSIDVFFADRDPINLGGDWRNQYQPKGPSDDHGWLILNEDGTKGWLSTADFQGAYEPCDTCAPDPRRFDRSADVGTCSEPQETQGEQAEAGAAVAQAETTTSSSARLPRHVIAEICHEANAAYCRSMGDDSQKPWAATSMELQNSALEGVDRILRDPQTTPEDSHNGWMAHKREEGWIYGIEKNEEKKTHPCMVPYDRLPAVQRLKDEIFVGIVKALR